jgi:hypothetical protein
MTGGYKEGTANGLRKPGHGTTPEKSTGNVGPDKKQVDAKIAQALGKTPLGGKK